MENCKLSTDLMVDILLRLPVKSLVRFKYVCKFFYDLITSDRRFMDTHYGIHKGKTDCVLLETGWAVRDYYLLYKESSEYNEIGCIYLDNPATPRQWVKCCQGMLCLISTRNDITKLVRGDYLIYDIWICNPSIRKVKALPSVTVPYRPPYDSFVLNEFGFGISNDMTWKVVMLVQFCSEDDIGRTTNEITLVYSQVRDDSWSLRQIDPVIHCRDLEGESNDFYFKGRYYWRTERYHDEPCNLYLIWFDMNNEVFGRIELRSDIIIPSISIMNDTIALIGYPSVGDSSSFDIWLMMGDENNTYWHKQASIDCVVDNDESWFPMGIWNLDGELLVYLHKRVEYDWDSDPEYVEKGVPPYFISVNLVTQERKMFSVSKERKSITMASHPTAGYFQVYNERNIDITVEWERNLFHGGALYARVYEERLHFL